MPSIRKLVARGPRKVNAENVNHPGHIVTVDADKYQDMRKAMLKALPTKAPGLTQAEARAAVPPYVSEALFPGGAKAGWWTKLVQLDLEAKGLVAREKSSPLRWYVLRR